MDILEEKINEQIYIQKKNPRKKVMMKKELKSKSPRNEYCGGGGRGNVRAFLELNVKKKQFLLN